MRDLVDFVLGYQWIWDGQVTKFFAEEWWTRIPIDVSLVKTLSSKFKFKCSYV